MITQDLFNTLVEALRPTSIKFDKEETLTPPHTIDVECEVETIETTKTNEEE
jgi:hypothetical protein